MYFVYAMVFGQLTDTPTAIIGEETEKASPKFRPRSICKKRKTKSASQARSMAKQTPQQIKYLPRNEHLLQTQRPLSEKVPACALTCCGVRS